VGPPDEEVAPWGGGCEASGGRAWGGARTSFLLRRKEVRRLVSGPWFPWVWSGLGTLKCWLLSSHGSYVHLQRKADLGRRGSLTPQAETPQAHQRVRFRKQPRGDGRDHVCFCLESFQS
jgi:hypothetical protein